MRPPLARGPERRRRRPVCPPDPRSSLRGRPCHRACRASTRRCPAHRPSPLRAYRGAAPIREPPSPPAPSPQPAPKTNSCPRWARHCSTPARRSRPRPRDRESNSPSTRAGLPPAPTNRWPRRYPCALSAGGKLGPRSPSVPAARPRGLSVGFPSSRVQSARSDLRPCPDCAGS